MLSKPSSAIIGKCESPPKRNPANTVASDLHLTGIDMLVPVELSTTDGVAVLTFMNNRGLISPLMQDSTKTMSSSLNLSTAG